MTTDSRETALLNAATRVIAWWDAKIADELSSHRDFPWAEDAEWDEFNALRIAVKALGASHG